MVERRLEGKYKFWRWLAIVVFAVLAVRLAVLQLVDAPVYRTRAEMNQFRFLPIRAPRGDIVDRKGEVLATNKIVNTISIVKYQIDAAQLRRTVNNLANLLHDLYPEVDVNYINQQLQGHETRSYEPVVIKRDVSIEAITRLEEHRGELPGVVIGKEMVRYYPKGTLAGHVLGHIGEISQAELNEYQSEKYQAGDLIGRFGLEKEYERYLRGENGFQQVEVDASGRPIPHSNLITVNPKQGDRLVLTLDAKLQQALEDGMDQALADMRKKGLQGKAGAAVVLDVRTGAVLAMTSRPSFDPNRLVPPVDARTVQEYLSPPAGSPPILLNRAIGSKYSPGSTFKPITGMAALESGRLSLTDTVFCSGAWRAPGLTVGCWGVHGTVNFFKAMAQSCNVFFIEAGRRAGVNMITRVAHEFGLDQKTGIDLPGEVSGSFLTPEKKEAAFGPQVEKWYQKQQAALEKRYADRLSRAKTERERNDILIQKRYAERDLKNWYQSRYNQQAKWQPYDTYFMSFGQGSNDYTPIGLANYVATLANGGHRMRPYLVQRIVDRNGKVVARFGPKEVHRVNLSEKTMATVRQAMAGVTAPGGTAYWIFKDFPVKVAAKTGTAQTGRGDINNGVFVAFAPADHPEIAFAGVAEYAAHGSEAMGPVAKEVFKAYFGLNRPQQPKVQPNTGTPAAAVPQAVQQRPQQPAAQQPPATQPGSPQPPVQPPQPPGSGGNPPGNNQPPGNGGTPPAPPPGNGNQPPEPPPGGGGGQTQ